MIFEPVEEKRILGFKWQGLFISRQREVADIYAEVISEDIITIENMGDELMHGASADRTRQMVATALRPAIDEAVGQRPAADPAGGGTPRVRCDPGDGGDSRGSSAR